MRAFTVAAAWSLVLGTAQPATAQSTLERDGADELEAALRNIPIRQDHGGMVDLAIEARAAAGSDAAAATMAAARWVAP
jgi:hypothetical protein